MKPKITSLQPPCRDFWLRTPHLDLSEDQLDRVNPSHVPLSCYVELRDRTQDLMGFDGLVVPSYETHCRNCDLRAWLLLKNGSDRSSPTKSVSKQFRYELEILSQTGFSSLLIPHKMFNAFCRLNLPTPGAPKSGSCPLKLCSQCFQELGDSPLKLTGAPPGAVFGRKRTRSRKTANTTTSSK